MDSFIMANTIYRCILTPITAQGIHLSLYRLVYELCTLDITYCTYVDIQKFNIKYIVIHKV